MALARAESIINADLRASEVNLENIGLDSLEPILHLLGMMPRLKSLRLAHNKLTGLPDDLACIRQLDTLDLSDNPVEGLTSIMRGLYNLVVLRHLSVDLPFATEEDELIIALPSLESLNGTSLTETYDEEVVEEKHETEHAAAAHRQARNDLPTSLSSPSSSHERPLTQSIRRPRHASANDDEDVAVDDGDEGEHNELDGVNSTRNLYTCVAEATGNEGGQREFDAYAASIVRHLSTLTANELDAAVRKGESLKAQRVLQDYCMEELCRTAARRDAALGRALSAVLRAQTTLYEQYDALWRRIADDRNERVAAMKRDMRDAIREIESLMGQVGGQAGPAGGAAAEVQQLREEIGWLRTENERLATRIRLVDASPSPLALRTSTGPRRASAERAQASAQPSQPPALGGKVLTLKQLKGAIEDIYASKSKYDIKCSESHLPRETMEQHMYTYLNQRYGLKHIILDWATAIINGIKKYGPDDNDVAVFGKILRNEIDEEFRFVQRQVRETVHELLRVYVKGKYPSKSDMEINRLVQKKTSGTLLEEEWVGIVKYMYNAQDSVSIILRAREYLRKTTQPRRRREIQRGQELPEDTVQLSYVDLIRILLDFQVEGHDRFLEQFLQIFRQYDTDRNGIINEQEFIAIVRSVNPDKTDEEIHAVLELIDPYGNQVITYSECVTYLSADIVKMAKVNERSHHNVTINMV